MVFIRLFAGLTFVSLFISVFGDSKGLPFDLRDVVEQVSRNSKQLDNRNLIRIRTYADINSSIEATGKKNRPRLNRQNCARKNSADTKYVLKSEGEFLIDTTFGLIPLDNQFNPSVTSDGNNYFVVWYNLWDWSITGTRVNPEGSILDPSGIIITSYVYPAEEFGPAVAFCGGYYLVVWLDYDYNIQGARVTTSGILLDTTPIPISTTPYLHYEPTVAGGRDNFLVVWEENDGDIAGARVDTSGLVLDTIIIPICSLPSIQYLPSVAFDGNNYFVVWHDNRRGTIDIYGSRVSPEGIILDPAGIPINTMPSSQAYPSITFGGSYYLVVWEDYRGGDPDIFGSRVTPEGTVLDSTGIPIAYTYGYQLNPQVTFGGINYLVVYEDDRSDLDYDIYGTRVSFDGSVLDPNGFWICTNQGDQQYPFVTFGIGKYFAVWQDLRISGEFEAIIYGSRITADGTVLEPNGFCVSVRANEQEDPRVAFDGTNYLVLWRDERVNHGLYGARVNQSGIVLDPLPIPICTSASSLLNYKVVFGQDNYLVVWEDYRNGNYNIYGTRITPAGVVLDPNGFAITSAVQDQWGAQVLFDGTNFFIVWTDNRNGNKDIYGARVTPEGTVLDPTGIPISTANNEQQNPSVALGRINYLVVWEDYRNNRDVADIYGARVSVAGSVSDPQGIPISIAPHHQVNPKVIFDRTSYNFFVVWEDHRNNQDVDIYGTRVTTVGVVLDPQGIPISTAYYDQFNPKPVFGGGNYFVVWEDYRNWGQYYADIYGARITTGGTVLDPNGIAIALAEYDQLDPKAIYNGTNYFILWIDYRNYNPDIYSALVSPQGTIVDSFPVTIQPGPQVSPSLVLGLGSQVLIVYTGWTLSPFNAYRIWGKLMGVPIGISEDFIAKPLRSKLFTIMPNPISSSAKVYYALDSPVSDLIIKIYNPLGILVKSIALKTKEPRGVIPLNLKELSSGAYIIQFENGKYRLTQKIILEK